MQINQMLGKYTLVQKAVFGSSENWVFLDGDRAVEWNLQDHNGRQPESEEELDRL